MLSIEKRQFSNHFCITLTAIILVSAFTLIQQANHAEPKSLSGDNSRQEKDLRMNWWRHDRFGMFIHWGLYSILEGRYEDQPVEGLAEWIMYHAQIPLGKYEPLAAQFNPVRFDANDWVRMARDAGMKYLVITSKHHDGFAMWETNAGDYNIIRRTPFKRDVLSELAKACRKYDVRLCFYYSIMDWHHSDYLPRRPWEKRSADGADLSRYIDYMKAQLAELVTRYDPAVLWFDGEWEDTWTHEHGVELYNYVRSLKPAIIINNRVDKGRKGSAAGTYDPSQYVGDFGTPEQEIPNTGLDYDWETCMTMNQNWGYSRDDKNWKSAAILIRQLTDTASKGGNFLLNIGPRPDGTFPPESVERLAQMGEWMKTNGSSIYGTTASPFEKLKWGRCTQKPDGNDTLLYLHVFDWPKDGMLSVPGLKNDVLEAMLLAGRIPVAASSYSGGVIVRLPDAAPDAANTVVVLKIKGKPKIDSKANAG